MSWNFDNSYFRELQGFYAPWNPSQPPAPKLLLWNGALADRLGLSALSDDKNQLAKDQLASELSGGDLPPGAQPLAFAYSGHQFGHFSAQLGDGRALLLGEQIAPDGARFDIQLKGSGRTAFSRNGDGKYALAPALREHLLSEAMAALGVPTTRSLAVTLTGEQVQRQSLQPGAVLTRVATSHIRVGTFQFFATHLGADHVRRLADHAIARHFPDAAKAFNPYLAFFEAVMEAQIRLVSAWVHLGFVHGVMNTDNVAISGETIDFGPCAFIDTYSAAAVFSSIDQGGRYAFGNQPNICRWNLSQLGSALAEVIAAIDPDDVSRINQLLDSFAESYMAVWLNGMRRKLGLQSEQSDDLDLANRLLAIMEGQNVDYTNLFRNLAKVPSEGTAIVSSMFAQSEQITSWLADLMKRLDQETIPAKERLSQMNATNPLYIPRNHRVEEALEAAVAGDMAPFNALLDVVTHPFAEQAEWQAYAQSAPPSFGRFVTFCGT